MKIISQTVDEIVLKEGGQLMAGYLIYMLQSN
jgi:hypothetical protein